MGDHARAVHLAAFRNLMIPLVRMALRHGLSYVELSDALARAIAECASDLHPSAKKSVSQLAILTGLPRARAKEVKEAVTIGAAEELSNLTLVGRLVFGWQREFVGPYGVPLELPLESGDYSFQALVRRFAGRASPKDVFEELQQLGLVELTVKRRVRLTNRPLITGRLTPESIERMSWVVRDLAETIDYNLNPSRQGPARFERRMYTNEPLAGFLLDGFRALAKDEGQAFLGRLDNWLSEQMREIRKRRRATGVDLPQMKDEPDARYVGVGIYWFENEKASA
jgi:hypothetical protein